MRFSQPIAIFVEFRGLINYHRWSVASAGMAFDSSLPGDYLISLEHEKRDVVKAAGTHFSRAAAHVKP